MADYFSLHYGQQKGFDDMDSIYASPDDFQSMNQKEKIRGIHLLQYFVEHSHQLGIQCEAWIRKGDPKEVICQEVKKVQPDMLVVGSRGLGPFQRVFVGTVSEYLVKHVDCPVVTIKRKADEAPYDPIDD
ncbi:Universal stress protein [Musa troglodytarum]|uniref:Universal stress protein n=1 Tax=Musa troglodytarum TaxID=320322 RepID=A0A9E7HT39_9LILI|nr:Universal stress protein [Musa troglodytarum]